MAAGHTAILCSVGQAHHSSLVLREGVSIGANIQDALEA